jgi:hypothetical protein
VKQPRDPTDRRVDGDEHLELLEMLHGDTAVPVGNYRPIQSGHSLGVRVPSETATMLKV